MAREPKQIPIPESRSRQHFEVRVRGILGPTLGEAFPTLTMCADGHDTVLSGTFTDQSELYGVLRAMEALGLTLLELRAIPTVNHQERPRLESSAGR